MVSKVPPNNVVRIKVEFDGEAPGLAQVSLFDNTIHRIINPRIGNIATFYGVPSGDTHVVVVHRSSFAGSAEISLSETGDHNHTVRATAAKRRRRIRYIRNIRNENGDSPDSLGWLVVKLKGGRKVSLPWQLKVDLVKRTRTRDHFRILEGSYMGYNASISRSAPNNKRSWLYKNNRHNGAAEVYYDRQRNIVRWGGQDAKTVDGFKMDLGRGTYLLRIPDYPHPGGISYLDRSIYALSWFRIMQLNGVNVGERYLHTGLGTLGCVTVNPREWNALYLHLVNSRIGTQSVGKLFVV